MNDKQLIMMIKGDNAVSREKALTYIYVECFDVSERMIRSNKGTREDAKDVFQDAMVVFYKKMKEEKFVLTSQISTYIYAISRNIWLKNLRSSKSTVFMDSMSHVDVVESSVDMDEFEYSQEEIQLGDLLAKSGEKCLKLLKLFYYEKIKMMEIAEILNYSSVQVAKNKKVRCLKKIRTMIQNSNHRIEMITFS